MLKFATFIIAAIGSAAPAPAGQPEAEGGPHARPALIAETDTARPGEAIWLALDFEIDEGWHTYWPGQNDSGFALDAKLESSSNAEIGDLVWPAPHRYFPTDGIMDHVFEERMTVLVPVRVDEGARPGEKVSVSGKLAWLVCEEICLPESAEVSIEVAVAAASPRPDPRAAGAFREARARVPHAPKPDDGIQISLEGDRLLLEASGASRLAFYPLEKTRRARNLIRDGEREGQALEIELREGEEPVAGVLEVWRGTGEPSSVFKITYPEAPDDGAPDVGP